MRRCDRCSAVMAAGRPRVRRGRELWCQTCVKDPEAPSGRYRPGTDIARTSGLSRDQNECDHQGPHNLHGQCLACGYTEPTEGDEPCDNPWCVEHEPEHTKAEHIDPSHLDPGHEDYQSAQHAINEALGEHAWLLDQNHQGPSHLSSKKTAQKVHHITVYVHTGHQHARQTETKPMLPLCDKHTWDLRHELDRVNGEMLDASDESNMYHRPIYGWRSQGTEDGTCVACTRDAVNDAFKTAHRQEGEPWPGTGDALKHLRDTHGIEKPLDVAMKDDVRNRPEEVERSTRKGDDLDPIMNYLNEAGQRVHNHEHGGDPRRFPAPDGHVHDGIDAAPIEQTDHWRKVTNPHKPFMKRFNPDEGGAAAPQFSHPRPLHPITHQDLANQPNRDLNPEHGGNMSPCPHTYNQEERDQSLQHSNDAREKEKAQGDRKYVAPHPDALCPTCGAYKWLHTPKEYVEQHQDRMQNLHQRTVPFEPLRQSLNSVPSRCKDCGGLEGYPGEHDAMPTLHGTTMPEHEDPSTFMDQRGVTNVPSSVTSPSEHEQWPHLDTERFKFHPMYHSDDRSGYMHPQGDNIVDDFTPLRHSLNSLNAKKEWEPPTVSGVALRAADTGRLLMIQRSNKDEKDPARGTWEFPGGHHEDGDTSSLHAGIREWEEEVGHPFPQDGAVTHTWRSGPYQGHVVTVPEESCVDFSEGRRTTNPDDPDNDDHEQSAWWDPEHARKNPALRQECKDSWKDLAPGLKQEGARNEGTVPFEDWTGGHPKDGGSYDPSEGGKIVGDERLAAFLIDHHNDPAGHMMYDHGFAPEMVDGLSPGRVLSLHESEHRESNRNPERTRERERRGHGIEHEHSRFTPSTSARRPARPRPEQIQPHPFTAHPDDPNQCVECNFPKDNRHHQDVPGHQPPLPGTLSVLHTAEWVHRPIYSGERITHTPGYPVKHPSGRTRLDVGDSLLWDSGKVSHIVATTDSLLKLHDRAMPMHRSGIEGDHSKAIWHNDGVDDDLKNSVNDIFKGSSRKTASEAKLPGGYLNEESEAHDHWAHPGPPAPYDPVDVHHGLAPKEDGHGPWHITRHPETRAYQLVDNQNRLVHSYSTIGHPSYERHDNQAETRAVHHWVAANQEHGHIPKWHDRDGNEEPETGLSMRTHMGRGLILPGTERARRKGEPLEDANSVDTQHVQFHAPAPPFPHSTEDPRDEMYRNRARHQPAPSVLPPKIVTDTSSREHGTTYRRAAPHEYDQPGAFHEPSPDDEYHGPYKVIQHAQTGKFHVVDNQGRMTDYGSRQGMDEQHHAEERRDYAEGRQRSKQVGRQIGESIFNGAMDILDPGGTPESRRTERHTDRLNDLGHRYEGGTHHPLTPGRFGADDYEHDGDGEGEPYYEVSHPSGYKARDYGGNNIHIYHAATGETAHDLVSVHGGVDGDFFTKGEKPPGFGHEDLHRELHAWVSEHGGDAEHHDPKIPRWQRRNGYTASKHGSRTCLACDGKGDFDGIPCEACEGTGQRPDLASSEADEGTHYFTHDQPAEHIMWNRVAAHAHLKDAHGLSDAEIDRRYEVKKPGSKFWQGYRGAHDDVHAEGVRQRIPHEHGSSTGPDSMRSQGRYFTLDEMRAIGAQVIAEQKKDPRFKGVTVDEDDDGFFVKTHRARSKSYRTPEAIPQKDVDFIESTGSLSTIDGFLRAQEARRA